MTGDTTIIITIHPNGSVTLTADEPQTVLSRVSLRTVLLKLAQLARRS